MSNCAEFIYFDDSDQAACEERRLENRKVSNLAKLSFLCNIVLFVLKIVAAVMSGSLAVIASASDSLLDLLSGSFLYMVDRFTQKSDPYKYPEGKSRVQPLGIIIFAAIMGVSSVQIVKEGMENLINGLSGHPHVIEFTLFPSIVMGITIFTKAVLWWLCSYSGVDSDLLGALAEDHRNDILTNTLSAGCAVLATYLPQLWWMDGTGAVIFGLFIMYSWAESGKEQIGMLVGDCASNVLLGQLTFLASHHDPRILRIDTVKSFHFGQKYLCEVDIVLPPDMTLKETHDIGESLQKKLGTLYYTLYVINCFLLSE